jgi:polyisoprenoid-binding protein YceI
MMRALVVLFLLCFLPPSARAADAVKLNGGDSPRWNIGVNQSTLGFSGTQMGAKFTGTVGKFAADIRFNLDHPETGSVAVDVDTASISTGDKDRDKSIGTPEWFDLAHFPKAQFKSDTFRKTGDKSYEGAGALTIKGISVPITLSFTIDPVAKSDPPSAHVKGTAVLDRSKFHLGTGDWADPSVVANEVTVTFDLTAYQAK